MSGEVRTPPFSEAARYEAGALLRLLQEGHHLSLPASRPMPSIGGGCHELRIRDTDHNWRIFYHISEKHIVILGVFAKKTGKTPQEEIKQSQQMLRAYQNG